MVIGTPGSVAEARGRGSRIGSGCIATAAGDDDRDSLRRAGGAVVGVAERGDDRVLAGRQLTGHVCRIAVDDVVVGRVSVRVEEEVDVAVPRLRRPKRDV